MDWLRNTLATQDLTISCSDDELSSEATGPKGNLCWMPSPEEILALYSTLEAEEFLPLEWKCPGRRPPSEDGMEEEEKGEKEKPVEEALELDKNFDFDDFDDSIDDATNSNTPVKSKFSTPRHNRLRTPISRTPGSVIGSARKKTTSLNGVLANMKKHKIMDEIEECSKDDEGAGTNKNEGAGTKKDEREGTRNDETAGITNDEGTGIKQDENENPVNPVKDEGFSHANWLDNYRTNRYN